MELILRQRLAGPEYSQRLIDQFEQLNAEANAARTGRVMAVPVRPFLAGQAHRIRYLRDALAYVSGHAGSWLALGSEIMDYYQAEVKW